MPCAAPSPQNTAMAPALLCAQLMQPLMRYARSRLRNAALAEDALSETLLAALESGQVFSTPAQATAWLYGVLRHKLVDELRRQGRETPAGDLVGSGIAELPDWDGAGAWSVDHDGRHQPEHLCSQRQLMALVTRLCDGLPPLQKRAFLMRELWGMDAPAVCQELGVTEGHLWVLLHRARLRLRESLRHAGVLPDGPRPLMAQPAA